MNKIGTKDEVIINTPDNLDDYRGEFIVFFPEDDNPTILFHSLIAEEAYQKAQLIKKELGREPSVIRIQETKASSTEQILLAKGL